MTFWLIALAADAPTRNYLAMSGYNDTDWSEYPTIAAIKKQLATADEFMPPESLQMQATLIGTFVRKLEKEDIITARLDGGAGLELRFAQVAGPSYYEQGENRVPVRWFDRKPNMLLLRGYMLEFQRAPIWPQEIQSKGMKQAIRNQLPLPGNRFRKWYWIIIVLLTIKLFMLAVRFSQGSGGL